MIKTFRPLSVAAGCTAICLHFTLKNIVYSKEKEHIEVGNVSLCWLSILCSKMKSCCLSFLRVKDSLHCWRDWWIDVLNVASPPTSATNIFCKTISCRCALLTHWLLAAVLFSFRKNPTVEVSGGLTYKTQWAANKCMIDSEFSRHITTLATVQSQGSTQCQNV